jgi:hypothetical protein
MNRQEILDLAEKVKECGIPGKLLVKGYVKCIENDKNPFDYDNLEITNKGKKLLEGDAFKIDLSWIDEYRNKFKDCNKDRVGDKHAVITKMEEFILIHGYEKEQILQAVDNYIKELDGDYRFVLQADYFISKLDGKIKKSRLLSYCEQLKDYKESEWG